jgi:serine/threonine-protein kinase RsbW
VISELSEDIRPGQADRSPSVRLTLPAVASNVALIRQVLAGLADDLGVDTAQGADMKIAVTEACTNVVVHAYPGGYGPVETEMTLLAQGLVVSVRDRGTDFKPSMPLAPNPATQSGDSALGFGLSLIAELSDEFAIRAGASGTEVQMLFAVLRGAFPDPVRPTPDFARVFADTSQLARDDPAPADGIMLAITPGVPTTSVFGRLISLLAARADFSIDRLSDAQLVSDALATGAAARSADQLVRIGVTEREGGFDLRIGPLAEGGADALVADTSLPGVGSLLERLSDQLVSEPVSGAAPGVESLRVRLTRDADVAQSEP